MKERLLQLAQSVRSAVLPHLHQYSRRIAGREDGGDPHFAIDEVAESALLESLRRWEIPVAYFSEDRGLIHLSPSPEWCLIVDPIDGTRPFLAGFESACFSAVVVPFGEGATDSPKYSDIRHSLVLELSTGRYFYADREALDFSDLGEARLSRNTDARSLFWSTELTAHPVRALGRVMGDLIDDSVTRGAVFVFTSSSYSLTRILSGQLDAHVDIGHRLLQDRPELVPEFLRVGRGKPTTLFPYDIAAAAYLLERAGGCVTDGYGRPLGTLPLLTDKSVAGQCSIIAAANETLHAAISRKLVWT